MPKVDWSEFENEVSVGTWLFLSLILFVFTYHFSYCMNEITHIMCKIVNWINIKASWILKFEIKMLKLSLILIISLDWCFLLLLEDFFFNFLNDTKWKIKSFLLKMDFKKLKVQFLIIMCIFWHKFLIYRTKHVSTRFSICVNLLNLLHRHQ